MHHPLGAPGATPSHILCIRRYRGGCHGQTFFSFFSLFCLLAIGRLHREIREKLTEDFWQKSWKSHAPLARATKINLQYIPEIVFVGPRRPPPVRFSVLKTAAVGVACICWCDFPTSLLAWVQHREKCKKRTSSRNPRKVRPPVHSLQKYFCVRTRCIIL